MLGANEFGPDFQRVLARTCMEDTGLRTLVKRFIQAGNLGWTDPGAYWVWRLLEANETVSKLMLNTEIGRLSPDDPARVGALKVATALPDIRDADFVRERVIEWARTQTFRLAFDEARVAFNAGDIVSAQATMMKRIEEMNAMRVETADRGWFFSDLEQRQRRRKLRHSHGEYFPSGIDVLDRAMGGGLHRGELEVPIAYSGIGKTFWEVQRGYIGVKLRCKVLHFPLEGGRDKTADRYEARFAETLYRQVKVGDIPIDVMERLHSEYQLMGSLLVLRGVGDQPAWSAGFDFIQGELDQLRVEFGWVPDLILVDYGDLLAEPGESEYDRQKVSYRKLKALSERIEYPGHLGYAVSSPSQAQRPDKGADEKQHVIKPRDIADCYEKVRVADVILSLNRTNDEKDAQQARVHLGKYRDDEDGATVRVSTDYTRGGFCRIGEPEPPDLTE